MKMVSFTPLSNYLDSVVRISVLSNSTVCSGYSFAHLIAVFGDVSILRYAFNVSVACVGTHHGRK